MNCEEFQRVLPQIIEAGGNAEEEDHLRSCDACSELVRDLKYIAEQARLLLPMRDPNPRVWNNIQQSLKREGLVQEGRMSLTGQTTTTTRKKKKLDAARNNPRRSGRSRTGRAPDQLSTRPSKPGNNGAGRHSDR